jgi:hypothetical protein
LTSQGGMWLNSIALSRDYQALGDTTISHELGHNMGKFSAPRRNSFRDTQV